MNYEKRELSIYIHIPFCKRKCSYCDFLSFGGCDIRQQKEYTDALCKEIEAYRLIAHEYKVVTIFIGGGTPSYIPAEYIGKVLEAVRDTFTVVDNAEITIEGNPDSLTTDKLMKYINYGINRLSIGLQSTNDEMLKVLGRVHNYDQFIAAYSRARKVGFSNINIDVMSGLPGESMESYVRTLGKVVELSPEHISAYSLIVEEETPLSENRELLDKLPSEEMDRKQYARTKLLLSQSGYNRYEISNYSRNGCECRHNLTYWTGGEYLGVGLSAASYMKLKIDQGFDYADDRSCEELISEAELYRDNEEQLDVGQEGYPEGRLGAQAGELAAWTEVKKNTVRFKGVDNLDEYIGRFSKIGTGWTDIASIEEYISNCYTDIEVLKEKDEMEEFMFLGLRCMKGISVTDFGDRFHKDIYSVYGGVIEKYQESGHLIIDGDRIYLSDKGIDVSNTVMAEFML